jgi:hypothetical protein
MAITPATPPSGADFSALVKKVNEVATKVGLAPLSDTVTGRIPLWKRWVGGEGPEYNEATERGLKTSVSVNADQLNRVKADLDSQAQSILELRADVEALKEAPPARPFP